MVPTEGGEPHPARRRAAAGGASDPADRRPTWIAFAIALLPASRRRSRSPAGLRIRRPDAAVRPIRKVLIANRGEIAVRLLRGLADLGIAGAVVYSEADRDSWPVLLAGEAYCIGPAPSRESYLRGERLIDLARRIGADAIHPGYGFLAENAEFAASCRDAGLVHRPAAGGDRGDGSKTAARLMRRPACRWCPVPRSCSPTSRAPAARRGVGYPVMLKAAAGAAQGDAPRRERCRAGRGVPHRPLRGGGELRRRRGLPEKYLDAPAHRDQVSPTPTAGPSRSASGSARCSAGTRRWSRRRPRRSSIQAPAARRRGGARRRAVGYVNAGTVEFLLAADGEFYFLEMNTRLQVGNPVTELVTGLDSWLAAAGGAGRAARPPGSTRPARAAMRSRCGSTPRIRIRSSPPRRAP